MEEVERAKKFEELKKLVEEIRECFADIPEDELQREIDKATVEARQETLRRLKRSRTA
jgi:hypothetical protein